MTDGLRRSYKQQQQDVNVQKMKQISSQEYQIKYLNQKIEYLEKKIFGEKVVNIKELNYVLLEKYNLKLVKTDTGFQIVNQNKNEQILQDNLTAFKALKDEPKISISVEKLRFIQGQIQQVKADLQQLKEAFMDTQQIKQ